MNLKHSIIAALLFANSLIAFGQTERAIDSRISNVTVFLAKAQVTREAGVRLEPGKTSIVITGLASELDPQSIQVKGKGNFIILGTSHRQNYLNERNLPKSLKVLKDSVGIYQK